MWLSVKTGGVVLCDNRSRFEVAVAAFTTSEWKLARQLYATLQPGDVVVADSAYGTYVDLALVHSANADAVFRKHHARHCDFVGKKLGIGDHIVQWQRPGRCPQCLQKTLSITSIEVREVHLLIQRPGFRPTEIILVTTLVDPKRYPKAKLAHLYQLRWQATEVNFKHLKTTLKMIFAKTRKWCRKKFGCICLRTTCCEA